jgi:hypothetical protein
MTDIVGSWHMNPESVKDLRDAGYAPALDPRQHTILLRPDGTCHFATLLEVIGPDGHPGLSLKSEGRWRIGNVGHQALLIDLGTGNPKCYYYFGTTDDGKMMLWQYASDPDAWRYIEYVK